MNRTQGRGIESGTSPGEQGRGTGAAGLNAFIVRWGASAGAERANYQLFLAELCDFHGYGVGHATTRMNSATTRRSSTCSGLIQIVRNSAFSGTSWMAA